ncbi:MAG: hypothetical protein J6Y70_01250 [Bacilli bacterium]|nr:hypothetical protein [Bacilli bacterium]
MKKNSKQIILETLNKLDIKVHNFQLYNMAFTHQSMNKDENHNYQKLEFIGDSILGSIISVLAYKLKPGFDEGQLTHLKIFLVNTKFLSELSLKYDFQKCIIAKTKEAIESQNVLADVFESFIGAFYLDNSYEETVKIIEKIFKNFIINFNYEKSIDFKTRLQEKLQNKYNHIEYVLISSKNTENNKIQFKVGLFCNNILLSYGISTNKKDAEQKAAKTAYFKILKSQI